MTRDVLRRERRSSTTFVVTVKTRGETMSDHFPTSLRVDPVKLKTSTTRKGGSGRGGWRNTHGKFLLCYERRFSVDLKSRDVRSGLG